MPIERVPQLTTVEGRSTDHLLALNSVGINLAPIDTLALVAAPLPGITIDREPVRQLPYLMHCFRNHGLIRNWMVAVRAGRNDFDGMIV